MPRKVAVADCETDPFKHDRIPRPFSWGFYDGEIYKDFWGDDSTQQFKSFLMDYPEPLLIYAHNGGKFDWHLLQEQFNGTLKIINGRITHVSLGKHHLRDSYANMPVPLRDFVSIDGSKKKEIDYDKLERRNRERYKKIILDYQKQDCMVLHNAITRWIDEFGTQSNTMAGAAMGTFNRMYVDKGTYFDKLSRSQDERFRAYFFGGRVQCFEAGNITGDMNIYDVTSMYPYVMKEFEHPIGNQWIQTRNWEDADFAEISAVSLGALPVRLRTGGIAFPNTGNIPANFLATRHEIQAGIDTGTLVLHRVDTAWKCARRACFSEFIQHFYDLRTHYRDVANDPMRALFYKLVMNSVYGKFALNPRKFKEYWAGEQPDVEWHLHSDGPHGRIWAKSADNDRNFQNVATAASITGAARSLLLRGIAHACRPIYCDTDSIICRNLGPDAVIDGKSLGTWKLEGQGDSAAIAGKKLYAIFGNQNDEQRKYALRQYGDDRCIKLASKGAKLRASDIVRIANGEVIHYHSEAPMFRLSGVEQLHREIRRTV